MKEIQDRMDKAIDCLESAQYNFQGGYFDAAANRAYYAVFDAMLALLLSKGYQPKSHTGARTLFAQQFILSGELPKEMSLWLTYCFDIRQQSDYDFNARLEKEETELVMEYASDFVKIAGSYLSQNLK